MIPFSPPRIDNKIIEEVTKSLKSGWITTGPRTKKFENKIAEYCNVKNVLCVSSATAGLELVLRWFGVKEGDEVIIPAYTYCATANVVVHCGAIPVMVDVSEADFNITVKNIENAITGKTKVIIPVDFGGHPCDYNEINLLVGRPETRNLFVPGTSVQQMLGRILVLSDSAHSFGADYFGNKTGGLTDITVFSFHAVKNLTTAEGGAIIFNLPQPFNNADLYNHFNIISLHGQNKDALAKFKMGAWKYDIIEAGYKANMTDVLASIGLVEIDRYENDTLLKRRYIASKYTQAFSKYKWAETPVQDSDTKKSSCYVYPLRIRNISEIKRDEIIDSIFTNEVSVNVHFQPLPMFSFYKNMGYDIANFPAAYNNYSREISLPVYYDMTEEQIDTVISVVIKSVEKCL